ncbi:MAG: low molecular weight protein-tyrosine-phosphatase [Ghiorsea sp.]
MNQTQPQQPLRVLFVCLGNICRSPLAEVVIKGAAKDKNMEHLFHFESAGTGDWHVGNGADVRSAATAVQHSLSLEAHKAQRITRGNAPDWDVFVAMDNDNRNNLIAMGISEKKVVMMRGFEVENGEVPDVPDPYYGGATGFEDAYQMLMQNADGLLDYLQGYKG